MSLTVEAQCQVILTGNDPWFPPLRREHALMKLAARAGHPVIYAEPPTDVRALLKGEDRTGYVRRLTTPRLISSDFPGIRHLQRSVLVPGHRGRLAATVSSEALCHSLSDFVDPDATMITNVPWDWPALSQSRCRRRVFDVGDDWQSMVPEGRRRFARLYDMIAAEADEIIVTNAALAAQFPGRDVVIVPNAVWPEHIGSAEAPRQTNTMVYLGTLSERFDSDLMLEVISRLPDWRLEIIGACKYAKLSDRPSEDLARLLAHSDQVHWHGQLARPAALRIARRATVALIPNRPAFAHGQDSMKLYDYSGCGVPVVASTMAGLPDTQMPPGFAFAASADEFAEAVVAAGEQMPYLDSARCEWARGNTWDRRWPKWSSALFGVADLTPDEIRAGAGLGIRS